jgi:WbqC-like protein family
MSITCAIHQPNYFPWLGYFDKIRQADIFVFLDDVQISKTGGSWVNRVKLNYLGKEKWFTCPINRPSGVININQATFAEADWKNKIISTLHSYYKAYPNSKQCIALISELINKKDYRYLAELNIDVITNLSTLLGYQTKFIQKSSLNISSHSTQMLIDICQKVGADTYLCGGGSAGYQQDEEFAKAGIKLEYQNFTVKPYGSAAKFLPGLSIIDFLMSEPNVLPRG